MSYPRIETIKEESKKAPTFTKAQIKQRRGEAITVPGQAVTLKTVIENMAKGFPLPIQRQELVLPDDVNQVLQGTNFDVPSDMKFKQMSKVERAMVLQNISGVKQQLIEKLDKARAEKVLIDQQKTAQETAPPPTQPTA